MIELSLVVVIDRQSSLLVLVDLLSHKKILQLIPFLRSGYDQCLEILLNYGMDPNIADQTKITPLHVAYGIEMITRTRISNLSFFFFFSIRYMKLSTAQFLINRGADPNLVNNRGETAIAIAKNLPADQRQNFLDVLLRTSDAPSNKATSQISSSDGRKNKSTNGFSLGNPLSQGYPLLRTHPNWTLDSDEFRSSTAVNSSVQNLLNRK